MAPEQALWTVPYGASPAWQSVRMTDRPLADGTRDVRRWPSDPLQLVDTGRCPACFTPLAGPRCRACDLDLDVPAAAELLALSTRVYDGELARQSLISQMRAAQAARTEWAQAEADVRVAPPVAAAGSVDAAVAVGSAAAVGSAVAAGPSAGLGVAPVVRPEQVTATLAPPPLPPAANPAPGPAAPSRPARSGVQVLLLTLGVVLISVTAVVFLFVAYLVASLLDRGPRFLREDDPEFHAVDRSRSAAGLRRMG